MASLDQPAAILADRFVEKHEKVENLTIILEHDESALPATRPEIFRSTLQEVTFILVTTMSVAMPSFLQGSTLVVCSVIQRDLKLTTSQLTWITASSSLTCGSLLLFFGRVADVFGRRRILLTSISLFAAFALATGFSNDALTLDTLNGLMGLTCASAIPSAQGIMGSIYDRPSKRKNYAFACFTSGNHLGFVLSAILSGTVTRFFGWRASSWYLAIMYTIIAIVAYFVVPADDNEKLALSMTTLKQFDVIGALLTISGIGIFSAGISIGPQASQGWRSLYVIVLIIFSLVLMAAFIYWECRFQYPLMPMSIWRNRDLSLLLVILPLGFFSFASFFFFTALYLQEIYGYSTLKTALCLIPTAISGIVVNFFAGALLHRISNKLLMGLGAAAFTLSFLLVAVQRSGYSYWAFTFPALIVVVVGTDLEFNVVNMYVVSALPKAQQSIACSIFQTTIKLAVTVGLGICAALFSDVSSNPATTGYYAHDPYQPYAALFWFSTAANFVGILLVPLLRIETQGHEA